LGRGPGPTKRVNFCFYFFFFFFCRRQSAWNWGRNWNRWIMGLRILRCLHENVCCSVLQCVAVCCSVFQCVPVRCSVLQCVAAPAHQIQRGRPNRPQRSHGFLKEFQRLNILIWRVNPMRCFAREIPLFFYFFDFVLFCFNSDGFVGQYVCGTTHAGQYMNFCRFNFDAISCVAFW